MSRRRKRNPGNPKKKAANRQQKRPWILRVLGAIPPWHEWPTLLLTIIMVVVATMAFVLIKAVFYLVFGEFLPQQFFSLGGFVVFLITSALAVLVIWRRGVFRLLVTDPEAGVLTRIKEATWVVLGIMIISLLLSFMVMPWLVHQFTAESARVVATVIDKDAYDDPETCSPRVELDLYGGSWLCINRPFFERLRFGDRLRLEGRQSPMGLSVRRYSYQPPLPDCRPGPGSSCTAEPGRR